MKVVTMLSGGLDSTTLLYHLLDEENEVIALSFDYGQRHKKELAVASAIAEKLKVRHHIITLGVATETGMNPLSSVLRGSSLTDGEVKVPDGHYAEESMKATVVPNRNAIMLSIAYGVAVAEQYDFVAFGAHSGDHAIYPDCRPEFVRELDLALRSGSMWDPDDDVPWVVSPFITMSKADIVVDGASHNVPFEETWSCYKAGEIHCGRCGTCVERAEAFSLAGIDDPTKYKDPKFWKEVVAAAG